MNKAERLAADDCTPDVQPVLFYGHRGTQWPYFSNFSRHPVIMRCPWTGETVWYATTEHRYQAMKADNADEHDWVVQASGPGEAKDRGRHVSLHADWGSVVGSYAYLVMLEAVMTKAKQHVPVLVSLRKTDSAPIYEDSPVDDIWGWRYREDYRGKNLLGEAWMQARALLLG